MREEQRNFISRIAAEISVMSEKDQMEFLKIVIGYLSDASREKWMHKVMTLAQPQKRWLKVENWMESRFAKDFSLTPRKAASVALHYMKIDSRMAPLMIKIAQKVKNRVRMRNGRKSGNLKALI